MRAGLRLLRGVYVILRTGFSGTPLSQFMERMFDILGWLLTHAPYLTVFGIFLVLLLLTQPAAFWAALRRPKVPRVPCSECGWKQPLPPTKGRKCRGCGVLLYPVDKHGKTVKW